MGARIFTRRHERDLAAIRAHGEQLKRSLDLAMLELPWVRGAIRSEGDPVGAPPAGPPIAFVHVPKTAGTTIKTMFLRAYTGARMHDAGNILKVGESRDFEGGVVAKVADGRAAAKDVVIGHSPFALLREHLAAETRYVTFLRDPVDRVISHYYRHIHRPDLSRSERRDRVESGYATAGSLEEAIAELGMIELTNLATRLLCDDRSPLGELSPSALGDAKRNLRGFTFVGITERSEESFVLLQRALELGPIPYGEHQRVGRNRPAIAEISDDDRALIAGHNRLDAELYQFARELFEASAAAAGSQLEVDVRQLRRMNEVAVRRDEAALEEARVWLDREMPPGTMRPAATMQAAAADAGISDLAFPRAHKLVGVREERESAAGKRVWRREGER